MYEIDVLSSGLKKRIPYHRTFKFRKGINSIVGVGDSGKSTLLEILKDHAKFKFNKSIKTNLSLSSDRIMYVDFEFCTSSDDRLNAIFKALRDQCSSEKARLKFLDSLYHYIESETDIKLVLLDSLFCYLNDDSIHEVTQKLPTLNPEVVVAVTSTINHFRKPVNIIQLTGK